MPAKIGKNCDVRSRTARFVEIFRSTPSKTVCPNFYVLAHANGCAFAPQCSYCYLKSSLWHQKGHKVYNNFDKLEKELLAWFAQDNLESYILNSGNLSDSLAFEQKRPMIGWLIDLFRKHAEAKGKPHSLLLVTKGGLRECSVLLKRKPCKNIITSFSLNAPEAARDHEKGAAPSEERLAAAQKLMAKGWRVRLRIDPMILGYDYSSIIEGIKKAKPERVTLGCLRAEPNLSRRLKFPIFDALEKIEDKKALARYPRPLRMKLYSQAVKALKKVCPIGLCEETRDVWQELDLDWRSNCCNCGK